MVKKPETKNPYDQKKQEAKYLAWQAGYNAVDMSENPYPSDGEYAELYEIWNTGFSASSEALDSKEEKQEETKKPKTTTSTASLREATEEQLKAELERRKLVNKRKELELELDKIKKELEKYETH